jgi:hypothetical protein
VEERLCVELRDAERYVFESKDVEIAFWMAGQKLLSREFEFVVGRP